MTKKLTPLQTESPSNNSTPIQIKETNFQPRLNNTPHEQQKQTHIPTNDNATRLRVDTSGINKSSPTAMQPTHMSQQTPPSTHRCLTRLVIARAANSVQLEQSKIDNPSPVTCQHLTDIVNPPSLLKYKELIKTADKSMWER